MSILELATPHGPGRAHLEAVEGAGAALVLGHGAGGGVSAPDLVTAAAAASSCGLTVALIEQPYHVAGRRSPAPAPQLDAAWRAMIEGLREDSLAGLALIGGGRSSGARVACRTAEALSMCGVLCLAFPLQPPGRRRDGTRSPNRLDELDGVTVPTLVVQGSGDPFGVPPPATTRTVVTVRGDHALKSDLPALGDAVRDWLPTVV